MSYFLVFLMVILCNSLAMRYITLNIEELDTLERFYRKSPDHLVRKRSQCLLLSHKMHSINELSAIFYVSRRTIER